MMTDSTLSRATSGRAPARSAKTKLTEVVLVCTKCAKRQGLRPRAIRTLLKKAGKEARREGRPEGAGKLRIVETGCLGPCPKRAVAVATGASLAAGRVILLDPDAAPDTLLSAVRRPVSQRPANPEFGPNTALAALPIDESPPAP
jgi:predicted metal-binding protein